MTSKVVLTEYADGWRLAFIGVTGAGNGGRDPVSDDKVRMIREALSPPFTPAKIRAADFEDDFGFCLDCEAFYCAEHWNLSPSGAGLCPAGHSKSLDPHWHPD